MGKKSLTKSTTKKKSTKKGTKKKTASASAKKTATNTNTKKSTGKKPTLKSLRKKQFEAWTPEKLFTPEPDTAYESNFAAPPSLEGKGKMAKKELLTKQFDFGGAKPKKSAPKKKNAQKTEAKSTKKAAPKKESAKKETKTTAKNETKKAPAKKAAKKSVSPKELLSRKFESWTPEKLFKPAPDTASESHFTAPPAFESADRALLLKTFDLSVADEPKAQPAKEAPAEPEKREAKAEKPAPEVKTPPKREPVPIETLLKMQFDTWVPEKPFTPEPDKAYESNFSAPPAFEGQNKALLLKTFDLSVPDEPKAQPAEEAPTEPEKTGAEAEPPQEAEAAETPEPAAEQPPEETPATTEEATPAAPDTEDAEATAPAAETVGTEAPAAPSAQQPEKAEKPEKPPEKPAKEKPKPEAAKEPKTEQAGGGGSDEPPEPPKPPVDEGKEPMGRGLKLLIATLGVIFALIIAASVANFQNFYIKTTPDAVEIWRGDFSPRGKHKVVTLMGADAPDEIKDVYNREKPMSIAYNYYMNKADALSEVRDLVDFKAIKHYLEQAKRYATTNQQRNTVIYRLNGITAMMLMYKAEVATEKQTEQGYEQAMDHLREALQLNLPADRQQAVEDKMAQIQAALEAGEMEAGEMEAEKTAAPEPEAAGQEADEPEQPAGKSEEADKAPADEKSEKPAESDSEKAEDQPAEPEADDTETPAENGGGTAPH